MEDDSTLLRKSKRSGVLSILFLFLLPVADAVDNSLWYIFLGLFGYFGFLFFWLRRKKPLAKGQPSFEATYGPSKWEIFVFELKGLFKNKTPGQPAQMTPRQSKLLVIAVLVFIASIFIFITLSVLFSSPNQSETSTPVYREAARNYYNLSEYDSSIYYYRLAILEEPEDAEVFKEAGDCFLNLNQQDSALAMYNTALGIQAHYADAQYAKGYIFFDRRDYKQAIQQGLQIVEYQPDYSNAMLLLGDCYYNQNQMDDALVWYDKAYATGYRSAQLSHFIAYIHDVKGRYEKAIPFYRETLSMDSSRAEIYTRLGELLISSNPEEALWFTNKGATLKAN